MFPSLVAEAKAEAEEKERELERARELVVMSVLTDIAEFSTEQLGQLHGHLVCRF
jgi:hypothetical protein